MNQSSVQLLDLPDEVLLNILKKLDNVDVLYALLGIDNERLNSLAREETFSKTLSLVSIIHNTTMVDSILDRFFNYILPQIHDNVKCLTIEPAFMERILLAANYSNLTELKIINFQRDNSSRYFADDSSLRHIFKRQITKLDLFVKDCEREVGSLKDYTKNVFAQVLTSFENLNHLNVTGTMIPASPGLSICYLSSNTFSSSTLTYLCINVSYFTDCLCLLDGRLKHLSTFIVRIYCMDTDLSIVHNLSELPNMEVFSLIHYGLIEEYNDKFVSLVRRMLYLEKLTLYLRIACPSVYMDPISLISEFSVNTSRLHSFNFYLSTENNKNDLARSLSNNNIKQNFTNTGYQEVSSIVSFSACTATHHVFTLPFEFVKLLGIGNIFPNIVFKNVIELCVRDMVPFEHEFFLRIAQAFPRLQRFYISDLSSQSHNWKKSTDIVEPHQIVEYPHLTFLDITRVSIKYVEQLLDETKTHLPSLTELHVRYEDLRVVTEDFTRELTRRNCAKVTRLKTWREIVGSKDFYIYFPLL
ncbi:unnamed protein product [Rotaria socialis]|uniref:F-box domain-containing protein n=1 Tax=Rotaria socialis TaxID=392032 RepID=A0A817Q7V5_9BILA|nr:unnamed protein product [Rotaria socialis]CAF3183471.1 unnamed protein product [Rotaria socialis]CAF3313462.1 unnamed protein product [Rotaria socialis]CAF3732921.1 unnamed protein product [Rotaria socialis]CAF4526176.1 unnamed protein product [Rotaria socialis]